MFKCCCLVEWVYDLNLHPFRVIVLCEKHLSEEIPNVFITKVPSSVFHIERYCPWPFHIERYYPWSFHIERYCPLFYYT